MRYHERKALKKGYKLIAGIDEAGRGPLAGPLVAACVILKKKRFTSTIKDSKELSPKKRNLAYQEITLNSEYSTSIIDEKIIDKINIYQATVLAMEECVRKLGAVPDFVLVDGGMKLKIPCPHKCIKGGDSKSISIAAASIVAKVTRDNLMLEFDRLYPKYGFARHKGYGTKEHFRALAKHGPTPIHRRSFSPVKGVRHF